MTAPANLVVIDTDVLSHVFVRASGDTARSLKERLTGALPVIATQTRAELEAWPRIKNWGHHRFTQFTALLGATSTVPVTTEVVAAHVELYVACRATGHALHQKAHTADRWVAATAIALDAPLLSLDRVFDKAPLLRHLPPLR